MRKLDKIARGCWRVTLVVAFAVLPSGYAENEQELSPVHQRQPEVLVESFTASLLAPGEFKLGSELSYGISERWNIGTDLTAGLIGVPTLSLKYLALNRSTHQFSVGLGLAYFDKSTILWGSVDQHFDHLHARVFKPALSYSRHLSHRLSIHSHWSSNIGRIEAELSETGRRRLWESKYPDRDYETRDDPESNHSERSNQAEIRSDSFAQRTMQVSSITGMTNELFQFTGEFRRQNGNKVLITNRMERTHLEKLRANFFRLTAAQQWVWPNFQFRLGVGLQYVTIHGSDLDGEKIDESGVLPASDIDFYWRF